MSQTEPSTQQPVKDNTQSAVSTPPEAEKNNNELTTPPEEAEKNVNKGVQLQPYTPSTTMFGGVHEVYYRPFTFHDGRIDGSVWIQGNAMAITTEIEDIPESDNNSKVKLDMIPYVKEAKSKYNLNDLKHRFIWRQVKLADKDGKQETYYLIYKNYYPDLKITEEPVKNYDITQEYKKRLNQEKKQARQQRREASKQDTTNQQGTTPTVGGAANSLTGIIKDMLGSNKSKQTSQKDGIEDILSRISSDLQTVTDMVKKAKAKGAFPEEKPKEEEPKDEVEIDPNTYVLWAFSFKNNNADFVEVFDFVVHSLKNNNKFMDSEEFGVKINDNLLKLPENEVKEEDIWVYNYRSISTSAILEMPFTNGTLTWDAIGTYMKMLKSMFGVKLNYMKIVKKDVNGNPLAVEDEGTPYIFVITMDTNIGENIRKHTIEEGGISSYVKDLGEIEKTTGFDIGAGSTQEQTLDLKKAKLHKLIDPDADENGASDDEDEKLTTTYGGKGKSRRKHTRPKSKTFKRRASKN